MPAFGFLRQLCSERIAFDISHDGEQVVSGLNREGLEPSLVEVPGSAGVEVGVPRHRVGDGQPSEEVGDLVVSVWPDDKMPVVRHDSHREDLQGHDLPGLLHDSLERRIVVRLLEERQPRDRPVEDMEHFAGRADSSCAWHSFTVPGR